MYAGGYILLVKVTSMHNFYDAFSPYQTTVFMRNLNSGKFLFVL